MIYLWVFTFLLHVRLDSSNFLYMLDWKDWNWISNVCKIFSSSKKTLTHTYVNLQLHSVQFKQRKLECTGFTKGGNLRSRRQKGKGKQNSGARRCWKREPFPLFSLFPPPRAPFALSRAQFPLSPSPFKAATQATFRGLILTKPFYC